MEKTDCAAAGLNHFLPIRHSGWHRFHFSELRTYRTRRHQCVSEPTAPRFPQAGMVAPTLTEKIHSYRIAAKYGQSTPGMAATTMNPTNSNEEKDFGEFRRKVKAAEVLSASMERLLLSLRFTGRVSVVMQNGRVLKSGYEESYFRQAWEGADVDDEIAHKR
jgi:hypothetical protein